MRIVPVLLLGFFVCNSIKTWNMNMYFGPQNGFQIFMKFEFMYYNYFAKARYFWSLTAVFKHTGSDWLQR